MKRILPILILAALPAGCASHKPEVRTSGLTLRSDSLNLVLDSRSVATLHDVTVIPADTTRDVVHIATVELDRQSHAQTVTVTNEAIAESYAETPPPVSGGVSPRWMPWIFLLVAVVIIWFRK